MQIKTFQFFLLMSSVFSFMPSAFSQEDTVFQEAALTHKFPRQASNPTQSYCSRQHISSLPLQVIEQQYLDLETTVLTSLSRYLPAESQQYVSWLADGQGSLIPEVYQQSIIHLLEESHLPLSSKAILTTSLIKNHVNFTPSLFENIFNHKDLLKNFRFKMGKEAISYNKASDVLIAYMLNYLKCDDITIQEKGHFAAQVILKGHIIPAEYNFYLYNFLRYFVVEKQDRAIIAQFLIKNKVDCHALAVSLIEMIQDQTVFQQFRFDLAEAMIGQNYDLSSIASTLYFLIENGNSENAAALAPVMLSKGFKFESRYLTLQRLLKNKTASKEKRMYLANNMICSHIPLFEEERTLTSLSTTDEEMTQDWIDEERGELDAILPKFNQHEIKLFENDPLEYIFNEFIVEPTVNATVRCYLLSTLLRSDLDIGDRKKQIFGLGFFEHPDISAYNKMRLLISGLHRNYEIPKFVLDPLLPNVFSSSQCSLEFKINAAKELLDQGADLSQFENEIDSLLSLTISDNNQKALLGVLMAKNGLKIDNLHALDKLILNSEVDTDHQAYLGMFLLEKGYPLSSEKIIYLMSLLNTGTIDKEYRAQLACSLIDYGATIIGYWESLIQLIESPEVKATFKMRMAYYLMQNMPETIAHYGPFFSNILSSPIDDAGEAIMFAKYLSANGVDLRCYELTLFNLMSRTDYEESMMALFPIQPIGELSNWSDALM